MTKVTTIFSKAECDTLVCALQIALKRFTNDAAYLRSLVPAIDNTAEKLAVQFDAQMAACAALITKIQTNE